MMTAAARTKINQIVRNNLLAAFPPNLLNHALMSFLLGLKFEPLMQMLKRSCANFKRRHALLNGAPRSEGTRAIRHDL